MLPDGKDLQNPLYLHFVMQICDTKSYQNQQRVCGSDRTLLSKKSLRSFFTSITQCASQRPECVITVMLLHDSTSEDLLDYCRGIQNHCSNNQINIMLRDLSPESGIANSIRACYTWMRDQGRDVVAQFQDDYIFYPNAIDDSLDVLLQVQHEVKSDAIVSPFHFAAFWTELYHGIATPRVVVRGRNDFWIQNYDISCSFMTTQQQFAQHWDLYEMFFYLINLPSRHKHGLESMSLNYILTQRGVLGIMPMRTLSHHVQGSREIYPYSSWNQLWDSIDLEIEKYGC